MKRNLLLCIMVYCTLLSCSNEEKGNEEKKIESKNIAFAISKIEKDIDNCNINLYTDNILTNKNLFNDLYSLNRKSKIKSIEQTDINLLLDKYGYKKRGVSDISSTEKSVLNSFFSSVKRSDLNSIAIAEHYINVIGGLKFNTIDKTNCINELEFCRDLMIVLKYDNDDIKVNSTIMKAKHSCRGRDCFDCCMYKKSKAVWEDGNWVDKAEFLAGIPAVVLWWGGSCGWDCV